MLMGLFELCLISLLSPQEPNAAPPHATAAPATPVTVAAPSQDPRGAKLGATKQPEATTQDPPAARLLAAESAKDAADPAELLALALGEHAAIAARATWLLGHSNNKEHKARLPTILKSSPHAEARLQAMQTIRVLADVTDTPLAIQALDDADRRVRTVAAQLLGRLRRPGSVEPLLGLIHRSAKAGGDEPATDVQAALLALTDIGAKEHLLRMATAIDDGTAKDTGEALAYAFQTLSPTLDPTEETTVLVAVLGHQQPLVRRYAITRLTELDNQTALSALEGRLANEGDALRPLVEVAISQLRNAGKAPSQDEVERARANAKVLWARIKTWWNGLEPMQQGIVGGVPALLLIVLILLRRAARRRAHAQDAQDAAAWVQPSDEYLDQQDEDYDEDYEDEDYEHEDAEFDDEFEEEEEEEGFDEHDGQPVYDTSGWDEDEDKDGDETADAHGNCPEDELFR